MATPRDRFRGVILGTAVGDALGLPAEGLSRRRLRRWFGGDWNHRFALGRGMISDDTEHTIFVAQSLLACPDSRENFSRRLAWCLRWWLISCPAGIGWATLRSIVRLWLGFDPAKSGVWSAGNGPAMRSAIIGAYLASSPERVDDYVVASTKITHADPRALVGARAVARLAAWSLRDQLKKQPALEEFLAEMRSSGSDDEEWLAAIEGIGAALARGLSVEAFAEGLGLGDGVTGYVYHTVPVGIYSWYHHFGDFEATLTSTLDCGGDTDTAGAIAGALAGAVVGEQGIPESWKRGILDWPRGRAFLMELADRLSESSSTREPSPPVGYFWPGLVARNVIFLAIVLLHGMRRLAPPY
jgi:ADP-ribosyl-[dinitrogen reductase] hydrolase